MRLILADFYLKFSFPGVSLPRVFVIIFYLDELSLSAGERARQFASSFYFNVDTLYRSFLSYRRLLDLKRAGGSRPW
ncbi:MAG TPA: hypothetical protein VKG02_21920 [Blastocatellia bacterium]|nr:hypothetical protein [Blastocatellia bacterium]